MNHRKTTPPQSVARKLTLLGIGIIAAILVLLALAISLVAGRTARQQVQDSVADKIEGIAKTMDATEDTQRDLVQRAAKTLQKSFEVPMSQDEATGEIKSYGVAVNDNFGDVDTFTGNTGNLGTVFAKKGDDFVRIASSLKQPDGERVLTSPLERTHPAYKLMLAGLAYTGREVLFGTPYMTHYEPLKNAQGKLIGILSAARDLTPLQADLNQMVANAKFFDTGGVYVIAPREAPGDAVFLVHPTASGKKLSAVSPLAMNEIVSSVQRVSDIIGHITSAASEQSDGIGEVNDSVNQLDQMTQQNAALVEESAAAAASLQEQAQRLAQAVSVFRLGDDYHGG